MGISSRTTVQIEKPPSNGLAITSMGCGNRCPCDRVWALVPVLGLFAAVTGFIPAVIAVITGHRGMAHAREMSEIGRGQAMAGLITGYITLGIIILTTAFLCSLSFHRDRPRASTLSGNQNPLPRQSRRTRLGLRSARARGLPRRHNGRRQTRTRQLASRKRPTLPGSPPAPPVTEFSDYRVLHDSVSRMIPDVGAQLRKGVAEYCILGCCLVSRCTAGSWLTRLRSRV